MAVKSDLLQQGFYNALTLIILGSVVGCFADRENNKFKPWIVLLCIALPLFAITKEDSSWIYLFIIPAFIVLLVYFVIEHRNEPRYILKRFCVLALPFLLVIGTNQLWSEINYQVYGVRITTDRNDGNYSRFINSLYAMSENDEDLGYPCWVSFDAIDKAIYCSPSLQEYKDYINNDRLKFYSPEINSGSMNCYPADMVFWYLKWCFRSGGLYENNPAYVNDYFGQVCNELDSAKSEGKISRSKKIFVSKSAGGLSKTQITDQLLPFYFENLYNISTYKDVVVTVGKDDANIDVMNFMTSSTYYTYNGNVNRESDIIIKIDNKIIEVFQIISVPIFYLGIICCSGSLLYLLIKTFKKDKESLQTLIPILGLILIALGYSFAISWFASGFGAYKNGHLSDYFHFLYYAGNAEFVLFALRLLGIGSICRLLIKRCKVNKHQ